MTELADACTRRRSGRPVPSGSSYAPRMRAASTAAFFALSTPTVATGIPKGSFYHHFRDKEDFALQVVDQYMRGVHAGLDDCLGDVSRPPLERVRCFFETTAESYRTEGYMGCLLGGLGQELSGVSDVFRCRIEECFSQIAERIAASLAEARDRGELPPGRDPASLGAMLDFFFGSVAGAPA